MRLSEFKKETQKMLSKAKAGYKKAGKVDRFIVQSLAAASGFPSFLCVAAAVEVTSRGNSDVALFFGTGAVLTSLIMGGGALTACLALDNLSAVPKRRKENSIPGVQKTPIVRERLTK